MLIRPHLHPLELGPTHLRSRSLFSLDTAAAVYHLPCAGFFRFRFDVSHGDRYVHSLIQGCTQEKCMRSTKADYAWKEGRATSIGIVTEACDGRTSTIAFCKRDLSHIHGSLSIHFRHGRNDSFKSGLRGGERTVIRFPRGCYSEHGTMPQPRSLSRLAD